MTADEFCNHLKRHSAVGILHDVDDVIMNTTLWWIALTFDKFGNPEKLAPKASQKKYAWAEFAPYYDENPEVRRWFANLRNSSVAHTGIPPIPHACEATHAINGRYNGARRRLLCYATARPQMHYGVTAKYLHEHGFPPAPVVLAPDEMPYDETFAWKADLIVRAHPVAMGIIDDNPRLITELEKLGYKGIVFLFGEDHEEKTFGGTRVRVVRYPRHRDVHTCVIPYLMRAARS